MYLRIGHLSTIYHTALIMQGLNLLEDHGIDPFWKLFGGGPGIVKSLASGELDIGYVGLPPAMIGMADEAPVKCVAGGHMNGTVLCMLNNVSKKNEVAVIKGLHGLRIGSPPRGSIHDIIIRELLSKYKVAAEVINYPWSDFIPLAMEQKEIEAAVGTPALGVFLKRELGAKMPIPPSRIWPFNPSYGIITRQGFIRNPALKVFLEVHEKACNHLINSPKKAARTVSEVLGFVDEGFAIDVIRLSPGYCASLPRRFIDSTMSFVPSMTKLGYISRSLEEKKVFDSTHIKSIHGGPDHYGLALNL